MSGGRLASWWTRLGGGPEPVRWVVLDVETTGLDPSRDRLLAIAAVAVHRQGRRLWIDAADSFDVVLRWDAQPAADKTNILLHGIGVGEQQRGVEAAQALKAFETFAGDSPRLGFHVAFDRAVIERACRATLGRAARATWLDIEPLAAVTHPRVRAKALDEWLDHFGIVCLQRHQATADTLATAELLLRLWPALCGEGATTVRALHSLAQSQRWVGGGA